MVRPITCKLLNLDKKSKQTLRDKCGEHIVNIQQVPEIRERTTATIRELYGSANFKHKN